MKKILCMLISILLIATLTACNKTEIAENTESTAQIDGANATEERFFPSETEGMTAADSNAQSWQESLIGRYTDKFSGRAVAEITLNEDNSVHIVVNWGNSAFETEVWEMDANLMFGKLTYGNCHNYLLKVTEDNEIINESISEDEVGYFEVIDGELHWLGAKTEYAQQCVFTKC